MLPDRGPDASAIFPDARAGYTYGPAPGTGRATTSRRSGSLSRPQRGPAILRFVDNLALNVLDAKSLISSLGAIGLLAILFAETGLLIGFFLPGDSLLILAGVAASSAASSVLGAGARLPLPVLLIGAPICAIAGAQLGHLLGAKLGGKLFDKPESKIFKRQYVDKAEEYFEKFGPAKAVLIARFIPVVRTFLNPVAGTLEMPARTFLLWNVIGGIAWTESMLLLGYSTGAWLAPVIDKYLIPAMALIILISISPVILEVLRERKKKRTEPVPYSEPVGGGKHRQS